MTDLVTAAVWLTIRLAAVTTVLLLAIATPLAWWLARSRSRFKPAVEAIVALPLVLPPTVLGFYLLLAFGPAGWLGGPWQSMTGSALAFSFSGLVIASLVYSFPFVVQPLQASFEAVGSKTFEAALCLRANPVDAFFSVVLPQARRGYLVASVLGFTHTLGEFGVVLMVGGNIPGRTQVLSVVIYDQVESINYAVAHQLSLGLLVFSFAVLLLIFVVNRRFHLRTS